LDSRLRGNDVDCAVGCKKHPTEKADKVLSETKSNENPGNSCLAQMNYINLTYG